MARPHLSSPDQPPLIRWPLRLYEFAASLSLAVVVIFSSAFTLGLATFVEAAYGTPVVQFYVYQTWWFEAILVLLAINIFCAAAIRYPWKRHQVGFVITHIGLLTLLTGAFISRAKGIDAQVTVFEGEMDKWAVENAVNLQLTVNRAGEGSQPATQRVEVNFNPGLFNWEDWSQQFAYDQPADTAIDSGARLPWKLFRAGCGALFQLAGQNRPGDVLYDRDGVQLEVLDYYSDSRDVEAPHVKFQISLPTQNRIAADGTTTAKAAQWMPAELSVVALPNQPEYPYGWSQRKQQGGGYFTLQLAGSEAQTESFLKSLPAGKLGAKGQAVLYVDGQQTRIDVAEQLGQERFKLAGAPDMEAEVTEYWPTAALADAGNKLQWRNDETETKPINPAVKIAIYRGEKKLSDLLLLALESQSSLVDHDNQIFGEYWFDHSDAGALTKEERAANSVSARIDLLQGADKKLYYRYWNRERIVFARELPIAGSEAEAVDAFTMPIGTLRMYVTQFIPSDKPAIIPAKHEFVKDRLIGDPLQMGRQPAAKFALTVDGQREEFWLFPFLATPEAPPVNRPGDGPRIHFVTTDERVASLTMPIEAIDIGFRVRLNRFERKLDPGTEQASHYASWVDFVDHKSDRAICRLPAIGARPQMYVSPKLLRPTTIALTGDDEDGLYWADERAGEMRSATWTWERVGSAAEAVHVQTELAQGIGRPTAIAVAPSGGPVYFADRIPAGKRELGVIRVIKNGQAETLAQLQQVAEALALDTENNYLYFAGRGQNAIGRINLASGDVEANWYRNANRPISLAVDAQGQQLLWTEQGENAIRRVKLDGTGAGVFLTRADDEQPLDLAIDRAGLRVYFMESLPNPQEDPSGLPKSKPVQWRLMSARLAGDEVRVECEQGIDEPKALTFDKNDRPVWTQTSLTRDDVWITMNAPVDCFDPQSGRSYRLFQERFSGPFKPGQALTSTLTYEDIVDADSMKSELYESILTVNYDPGRGVRNVGCLLIVMGIATMFYMRAYFFKTKIKPIVEQALPVTSESCTDRSTKKQHMRMT